jgi:hypothetical protein
MDQEKILALLKKTIIPTLEATLIGKMVLVFYKTPDMNWSEHPVFTKEFLKNQATLLASHVQEGQTLKVEYSPGYSLPEITFTVS